MPPIQQHLLSLVRAALSGSAPTLPQLTPSDWDALRRLAWREGVAAIALDALNARAATARPSQAQLLQWIANVAAMERAYALHQQCLTQLAAFYSSHGIRTLLLKGYGCSLSWPQPNHRPTGDADIYLFGRQDEADALAERELGVRVHREYHKHSTFGFRGVEVENHAKFIDDVTHRSNIRFERTLMSLLREDECEASPIAGIVLPPPTFNALFLLRHTGEHFASNEITLRHIIDVGTFFLRHHTSVDWATFTRVLREERMEAFFCGLATVCTTFFGMDAAAFAVPGAAFVPDEALARRILADIFCEKERLPMSVEGIRTVGQKLRYATGKTRRWWRNRWKYRLVYDESLLRSFLWLARNRISG